MSRTTGVLIIILMMYIAVHAFVSLMADVTVFLAPHLTRVTACQVLAIAGIVTNVFTGLLLWYQIEFDKESKNE